VLNLDARDGNGNGVAQDGTTAEHPTKPKEITHVARAAARAKATAGRLASAQKGWKRREGGLSAAAPPKRAAGEVPLKGAKLKEALAAPSGIVSIRSTPSESGQSVIVATKDRDELFHITQGLEKTAAAHELGLEAELGAHPRLRVILPDADHVDRDVAAVGAALARVGHVGDPGTHIARHQVPLGDGILFEDLPDRHGETFRGRKARSVAAEGTHGVGVVAPPTKVLTKDEYLAEPWIRRPEGVKGLEPDTVATHHHRLFTEGQEDYEPVADLAAVAAKYRASIDLPEPKIDKYREIEAPLLRLQVLAHEFDTLNADPAKVKPETKDAYAELVKQTLAQMKALTDAGYRVDFIDQADMKAMAEKGLPGGDPEGLNPYATAADQAEDLRNNKHLFIATIHDWPEAHHPLLDAAKGGAYDQFRAVHDAFGHAASATNFSRHGEYQAWLSHMSMFDGIARQAASTELTGENSFLASTGIAAKHRAELIPTEVLAYPFDSDGTFVADAWRNQGGTAPITATAAEIHATVVGPRLKGASIPAGKISGPEPTDDLPTPKKIGVGPGKDAWWETFHIRNSTYVRPGKKNTVKIDPGGDTVKSTQPV
jgi:hypothetical protein